MKAQLNKYIYGVKSADEEKVKKMEKLRDDCIAVGINIPEEVSSFLDNTDNEYLVKLRPGIEKGVTKELYPNSEVINISLNDIDKNIDVIRIEYTSLTICR